MNLKDIVVVTGKINEQFYIIGAVDNPAFAQEFVALMQLLAPDVELQVHDVELVEGV